MGGCFGQSGGPATRRGRRFPSSESLDFCANAAPARRFSFGFNSSQETGLRHMPAVTAAGAAISISFAILLNLGTFNIIVLAIGGCVTSEVRLNGLHLLSCFSHPAMVAACDFGDAGQWMRDNCKVPQPGSSTHAERGEPAAAKILKYAAEQADDL